MAIAQPIPNTADAFLAWAAAQDESPRVELIDGEIVAMTGGRAINALVAMNLGSELRRALADTACAVYADAGVRIADETVLYPDVVVSCTRTDPTALEVSRPVLVVEILSPTTAQRDRGQKLHAYRSVPSIQQILLVDPIAQAIESYRRTQGSAWLIEMLAGDSMAIESLDATLARSEVFRGC